MPSVRTAPETFHNTIKKTPMAISRYGVQVLLFLVLAVGALAAAQARDLTLALANSTCAAMSKAEDLYRAKNPVRFVHLCKSSGLLAKGLAGGALEADLFVSADQEWMAFAVQNGLVAGAHVVRPWGNALVLATSRQGPLRRVALQDLASDRVTAILIGDPSTAPFGRHAKEALVAAGLWDRVKHKIQTRKNIDLLVDSLASSRSATVGIVFKTHVGSALRPLHTIEKSLHTPIRYYVAPVGDAAADADVRAFFKFLQSQAVGDIFEAEGFDVSVP